MKWPNNIHFCKKCGKKVMPQWFRNKREEWVDMDYPYETFRPCLLRVAERDLCDDCRKMLIESVDAANHWEAPDA